MSADCLYFSGVYENRLSAKGQVALPARFRQFIPDDPARAGFVLLPGRERCLYLYSAGEFAEVSRRAREAARGMGASGVEFHRRFREDAVPVEIDAQGRMVIPEALRDYAGLTGHSVRFVGMGDRVELWDVETRAQTRMEAEEFDRRRSEAGDAIFGL